MDLNNKNIRYLIVCVLALAIIAGLVYYSRNQAHPTVEEGFTEGEHQEEQQMGEEMVHPNAVPTMKGPSNECGNPEASEPMGHNEVFKSVANFDENNDPTGLNGNQLPKDCYPKDQLTPGELLPQDPNSKWAQVNPSGQGGLENQNFLNAGHHVGMNTVGQTLRNANYQLRSEPPNPQVKVSPWQQSTIEPDTNRRPMEIGGCE